MKTKFFSTVLLAVLCFSWGRVCLAKSKEIVLSAPMTKGTVSLEEAIQKRRSERNFNDALLNQRQISQLLWSAQGITSQKGARVLRAAPSAGALFPMELVMINHDGVFRYLPEKHSLEIISQTDLRAQLSQAAAGQNFIAKVPVNILICANYSRLTQRYGKRGIRYADMEAGHIAQNIHLEAVTLGLGSVPVGAFDENLIKAMLPLPKELEPLYIIPVGYPTKVESATIKHTLVNS